MDVEIFEQIIEEPLSIQISNVYIWWAVHSIDRRQSHWRMFSV